MRNEPLVNVATVTAAAAALIGLLVAFGVPLTEDQEKALLGVVAIAAPFVVAYFGRKRVTPTAKAKRAVDHLA